GLLPDEYHLEVLLKVVVLRVQRLALLLEEKRGIEDLGRLVRDHCRHLVDADARRGESTLRELDLQIPLSELGDDLAEAKIEVPVIDRHQGKRGGEERLVLVGD